MIRRGMDAFEFIDGNGREFFESDADPDDCGDEYPVSVVSVSAPSYVMERLREETGERGNVSRAVQDIIVDELDSDAWTGWLNVPCCAEDSRKMNIHLEGSTLFRLNVDAARFGIGITRLIRLLLMSYFAEN